MIDVSPDPIRTKRLVLHPLRLEHSGPMWEVLREPEIYTWFPREPPQTPTDLENRFRVIAQGRSDDGLELWFNWTIWDCENKRAVGLVEATARTDGGVRIAYMIRPSLWRCRYGYEAVAAVIDVLFSAKATVFEAEIDTRNHASLGLVAALGFSLVERRVAIEWFKGAWSDEELWRLTPQQWAAHKIHSD
jgi:[ribosomal protein S5]-alanine N-acetyltransferase